MSIILTDRFQFAAMKGCLLVEGVHSLNGYRGGGALVKRFIY